jgi:hypothetical protein
MRELKAGVFASSSIAAGSGGRGQDAAHRRRGLGVDQLGRALEVGAGHLVEHHRKGVLADAHQRTGELEDGVVGARQRAVTTRIGGLEVEALEQLLAGLDVVRDAPPLLHHAAPTFVEGERGVDQVAVVLEQVLHAVVRAALPRRR